MRSRKYYLLTVSLYVALPTFSEARWEILYPQTLQKAFGNRVCCIFFKHDTCHEIENSVAFEISRFSGLATFALEINQSIPSKSLSFCRRHPPSIMSAGIIRSSLRTFRTSPSLRFQCRPFLVPVSRRMLSTSPRILAGNPIPPLRKCGC